MKFLVLALLSLAVSFPVAASDAAAIAEMERLAPGVLGGMGKDGFYDLVTNRQEVLDALLLSGPVPDDFPKALRILRAIWVKDPDFANTPSNLGTAAAVALTFAQPDWPEDKAVERYVYFRDSEKAGLLHPVFHDLRTWEKRYVVSVGQNGGWSEHGPWSDPCLPWLRDNVKLPVRQYLNACWQAPYRSNNIFGDSVHGKLYYMPFADMNPAKMIRDVGGVCGALSHYGASAARANGIPAITMAEPAHCSYAVRVSRDEWKPAYTLSWKRSPHTSLWGQTWTQLVLQNAALNDQAAYEKCARLLWRARDSSSQPDVVLAAYRQAVASAPLYFPAWQEYLGVLKNDPSLTSTDWTRVEKNILSALADYPEAASSLLSDIQAAALKTMKPEEQLAWLTLFYEKTADHAGPVVWDVGQFISSQMAAFPKNKARQAKFLDDVLRVEAQSPTMFASLVTWGLEYFGKNPATRKAYMASLERIFTSGDVADENAIAPVILAAERAGDLEAFQSLTEACRDQIPKTEPIKAAFPGVLLSSGGLLQPSSTCRWDHPEQHAGVLEITGGSFHTDKQVRPNAVVRLKKLGELTGIEVVDSGSSQNRAREVPLTISLSEDGKNWTQVFRSAKLSRSWRVDLQKTSPRARFVKVERDDDRSEFFHLRAILVYGRELQ